MRRAGVAFAFVVLILSLPAARSAAPVDRNFPGTMQLRVDLRDIGHRLFRVEQTIPVRAGTVTLRYPQWTPGNHAPRGPIEQLGGLTIRAGDQVLAWQRDPYDVYSFRVQVPAGAAALTVSFQVATPQSADGGQGRVVVTSKLLGLQWNQVVLYPDGYYTRRIPVAAQVRLPDHWAQASGLPLAPDAAAGDDGWIRFAPVSVERLVDSPLFAGEHSATFDLGVLPNVPVRLNVFAEDAADLAAKPEHVGLYRALVGETYLALGRPRYESYDYLLALSDHFGGIGLEHQRSSENSQPPGHFREWNDDVGGRDLLAHEHIHSWNGKFRRPAKLWQPTFNLPMQDDLLWVYEGMTEFYGYVLSARAGLWTPEFARAVLAHTAAVHDRRRPGREWRPLADTTYQPIIGARRPLAWTSWQRGEDYYSEGALLWLDADMRVRELTGNARSLDDFSRTFFAAPAREGDISIYERADIVRTLAAVAPFDWAGWMRERVDVPAPSPTSGLERAGWQLVYVEEPSEFTKDDEKTRRITDLSYSLGMTVNRDGVLNDVVWEGPAFNAGLTNNTTLIAVNGRAWNAALLKDAVRHAKTSAEPIELLVRNQDRFRTVQIDYHGGLAYPQLQRIENRPDRLAELLAPRARCP